MTLPTWDEVDEGLHALNAPCGPAEAHGMLCGLLAFAAPSARDVWLERAAGGARATAALEQLHDETLRQLDDPAFGFELLMPPEDGFTIGQRTDALAHWCTGFATGAGLSGLAEDALAEDVREFLVDVTRISQAEAASGEDDEAALAELVEYVRVGALLARTEGTRRAPGG